MDNIDATHNLSMVYDSIMGDRPQHWLQHWDKPTAVHMKDHHRYLARAIKKNQKSVNSARVQNSAAAIEDVFQTESSMRKGGMGSLLTLAFGEGTAWHKDRNDYPQHYSILTVTGGTAILYLDGVNQGLHIKPGDVVAFLASQVKHKLVWDGEETGQRFVYTCFTCKQAMKEVEKLERGQTYVEL